MWSPDTYLESLYRGIEPQYRFQARTVEEWSRWREALRRQFVADLGGFPARRADLNARLVEETACDGYMRQRVEFVTYEGMKTPAYVLIPDGRSGKLPAVIACHGHGYGSREIVGLTKDGSVRVGPPNYHKDFAIALVRRGFVVIVPELLGFGDRRMRAEHERDEASSCHSISTFLLQMGQTMAGHRTYEAIRAIDYAETREEVDPARIGMMGISGGGLVTTFATAVDDRVRAAVVSGYVCTFKDSILGIRHCVDNFVPGLHRHAEEADIVGLIAPRPLLVEAGTRDPIFPIGAALRAFDEVARVYKLLGAEERLEKDVFEGDHEISGALAYDWLARWL